MRIITGRLKGRPLKFPQGIRPTAQKVRKAIFDILGDFIKGSVVLELFAGSAAVGLEAISCGAREVHFVDNNLTCLRLIEANLKSLGVTSCHLYKKDSFDALDYFAKRGLGFDLIFLDPPYNQGLAKNSLLRIAAYDILKPLGLLIIEHQKKEELPEVEGGLMLYKKKKYSQTFLSIYRTICAGKP